MTETKRLEQTSGSGNIIERAEGVRTVEVGPVTPNPPLIEPEKRAEAPQQWVLRRPPQPGPPIAHVDVPKRVLVVGGAAVSIDDIIALLKAAGMLDGS